jgi:hypothetical protein
MAQKESKESAAALTFRKRPVRLPDGRRLIFYSFEGPLPTTGAQQAAAGGQQPVAGKRAPAGGSEP